MPPDAVTFVGHSTVLIELGGLRFLTDPLLRPTFLHGKRVAAAPPDGLLDGLDGLLVSHLHMDHLDFKSIRALDRQTPVVVPAGGGRVVRRRGFSRVTELEPGDSTALGGVGIRATPAEHDGRRWPLGRPVKALGYVLSAGSSRVYFAGDTDLFDGMDALYGEVDVALLPIGGWGPRIGDGHMDGSEAAEAAARIGPGTVIPIHWGTYLRSDLIGRRDDLLTRPPELLREAAARLAPDVDVRILQPGERLAL